MTEKYGTIDKISGLPEEIEVQALESAQNFFEKQPVFEEELEKSPDLRRVINLVDSATNRILVRFGLTGFRIPPANIHVIARDVWERTYDSEDIAGLYNVDNQAINMSEQSSLIKTAKLLFHEMMHMKAYQHIYVHENTPVQYRGGLRSRSRSGDREYFEPFNEAVVEICAKQFIESARVQNNPLFHSELEDFKVLKQQYGDQRRDDGKPLINEDTYYGRVLEKYPDGSIKYYVEESTHKTERRLLTELIDKILEKSPQPQNEDEVFDLFIDATLSGHLLPLAHMIDDTFGRGTFRRIAEAGRDVKQLEQIISGL